MIMVYNYKNLVIYGCVVRKFYWDKIEINSKFKEKCCLKYDIEWCVK